jgi:hypothetical protein
MSQLYEDRAAALGRIGGTLETLLPALDAIRTHLPSLPCAEREAAVARYRVLREKAQMYRWYLEVQREAVGLTQHALVEQLYPLPPEEPAER